MKFATLCSGIGAPEQAWIDFPWTPAFCAEIEPFPCAVLAQRHPETRNMGNIVGLHPNESIDLLIAGTPCQSFSVAGKRAGLDDARGVLVWEFLRIARELQPRWIVWENVPGVLSSGDRRDFGNIIGAMEQLGYGVCWRVLDAQYFGVPQRRRRVFAVGYFGDWRRAAAVLFDAESLRGDSPARGTKGQEVAGTFGSRATAGGGFGTDFELGGGVVAGTLKNNHGGGGFGSDPSETFIVPSVSAKWSKGSGGPAGDECQNLVAFAQNQRNEVRELAHAGSLPSIRRGDAKNETLLAFSCKDHGADVSELSPTLRACQHSESHANGGGQVAVAIRTANTKANGHGIAEDCAHTLDGAQGQAIAFNLRGRDGGAMPECADAASVRSASGGSSNTYVGHRSTVRRLTPRECERLQGFPDDYTLINFRGKPAADGPRYRAIGNSMAVPVIRWIGKRIQMVEAAA